MVWKEAPESSTQSVGGEELGPGVASMVRADMGGGDDQDSIIRETVIALGKTSRPEA